MPEDNDDIGHGTGGNGNGMSSDQFSELFRNLPGPEFTDNDEAMVLLETGQSYFNGDGVEQDYARAFDFYQQARALGSIQAIVDIGMCYYYGHAVPVDYEQAYKQFTEAALLVAHPEALYKLGDMYSNGYYVGQDLPVAFHLYVNSYQIIAHTRMYDEMWPDVCWRMGDCVHHGRGTARNLTQALGFYHEAEKFYLMRIERGGRGSKAAEDCLERVRQSISDLEDDMLSEAAGEAPKDGGPDAGNGPIAD